MSYSAAGTVCRDSKQNQQSEEADKGFSKYLKDKGIDPDEDYHWLSEAEQNKIKEEYNNKDKG